MGHLLDLIGLLLVLALTALCVLGWGRLFFTAVGLAPSSRFDILEIWAGFGVIVSAVEIAHLFVPIDWRATAVFGAIGLGGLWFKPIAAKQCVTDLAAHLANNPWLTIAAGILWVAWCGNAMGFPDAVDSGGYHYQVIRWITEHPIVVGLGNVHNRFGYNQSYFGYIALLNASPLYNRGYAVGGLFLLTLLLITAFAFPTKRIGQSGILICSIALLTAAFDDWIGAPNPDLPGAMLQIMIFLLLLRIALVAGIDEPVRIRTGVCLFLLCATSVTLKLSGTVFAAASLLIALPFLYRTLLDHRWVTARVMVLCFLFVAIHLGRGYLLSGAPLYPSTFGGAWGLDWAVSIEAVRSDASWIASWARKPDTLPQDVLGNWDWLSPWAKKISVGQWLMLFSPVLPLLGFLFPAKRTASGSRHPDRHLYALYVPFIAAIVFWFFTAPSPRFLGAILYLQAIFSIWLSIRGLQHAGFRIAELPERPIILRAVLPLALIWVSGFSHYSFANGWREIPSGWPTEKKTTKSGLQVTIPLKEGQCWSDPPPCTPYFDPNLRLRNPEVGLRSGFTIK